MMQREARVAAMLDEQIRDGWGAYRRALRAGHAASAYVLRVELCALLRVRRAAR